MEDFLANKIIDDFLNGSLTAEEAWKNLREGRDIISDERHDEIVALITEHLIEAEIVEDCAELELDTIFDSTDGQMDSWNDQYYEGDWTWPDYGYDRGDE